MRKLSELLVRTTGARLLGAGDPLITGLAVDSRRVGPGALFAALPGRKRDGGEFLREAVARGAAAALVAAEVPGLMIPQVVCVEPRQALAEVAAAFYGQPDRQVRLAGVTGTNGKTTIAYLLAHLLRRSGVACGLLGTIVYDTGAGARPAPLTTPESVDFSALLAEMAQNGLAAAAVEVSSHALVQYRTWPHRLAVGIFTNLTRDHLDYHGDLDTYAAAKRLLFERLDAEATAVVNVDDPRGEYMAAGTKTRVLRYGFSAAPGGVRADAAEYSLAGTDFTLDLGGARARAHTPLVGRHNVANCLAAVAATWSGWGLTLEQLLVGLADFPGVPGRLERVGGGEVAVFVDYAHTDDALRNVLSVLKPLTPGKLWCVFGCGGDRDRGKRPLMARAVEEFAAEIVVTADNPRTEDPAAIVRDILPGFSAGARYRVIHDRRRAVAEAVGCAAPGDVVLIAGKGHEDYQIIGEVKHHLDDRELAREALAARGERDRQPCV